MSAVDWFAPVAADHALRSASLGAGNLNGHAPCRSTTTKGSATMRRWRSRAYTRKSGDANTLTVSHCQPAGAA